MTEHPHRICIKCIEANHMAVRGPVSWTPGVCAICMSERRFTTSISNVIDRREGLVTAAAMIVCAVFVLAGICVGLAGQRWGFLG